MGRCRKAPDLRLSALLVASVGWFGCGCGDDRPAVEVPDSESSRTGKTQPAVNDAGAGDTVGPGASISSDAGSAGSGALAERLAALAVTAADVNADPRARRRAVVERARLLGIEVPDQLERAEVPAPPRLDIPEAKGEPTDDAVESGSYVLSMSLEFTGGVKTADLKACTVDVRGERIRIRVQRQQGEPMVGSLRDGRLVVTGKDEFATVRLEGQVVAPNKLLGTVSGGYTLDKAVRVTEGRWMLERVP